MDQKFYFIIRESNKIPVVKRPNTTENGRYEMAREIADLYPDAVNIAVTVTGSGDLWVEDLGDYIEQEKCWREVAEFEKKESEEGKNYLMILRKHTASNLKMIFHILCTITTIIYMK